MEAVKGILGKKRGKRTIKVSSVKDRIREKRRENEGFFELRQ